MKEIVKNVVLALLMVSTLVGAYAQMIAWNDNPAVYNAYFQGLVGICLFMWLSHKILAHYDSKTGYRKVAVNARDAKDKK